MVSGLHTISEIIRAGHRSFQRIMVSRSDGRFSPIVSLARSRGIPIVIEPRERLDRLASHGHHQGIVGIVTAKTYTDEDTVIAFGTQQRDLPFFLILDGIEDPQNLGAILRTAEIAGVHGVFIPDRRAVGLTPAVAKASSGALDHIHVAQTTNIGKLIDKLRQQNILSYGFIPNAQKHYTTLDFCGPLALVLGAEGKGIRPGVAKKCEDRASIPVKGHVCSLNVSASAAIVLFEVIRQREKVDCVTPS